MDENEYGALPFIDSEVDDDSHGATGDGGGMGSVNEMPERVEFDTHDALTIARGLHNADKPVAIGAIDRARNVQKTDVGTDVDHVQAVAADDPDPSDSPVITFTSEDVADSTSVAAHQSEDDIVEETVKSATDNDSDTDEQQKRSDETGFEEKPDTQEHEGNTHALDSANTTTPTTPEQQEQDHKGNGEETPIKEVSESSQDFGDELLAAVSDQDNEQHSREQEVSEPEQSKENGGAAVDYAQELAQDKAADFAASSPQAAAVFYGAQGVAEEYKNADSISDMSVRSAAISGGRKFLEDNTDANPSDLDALENNLRNTTGVDKPEHSNADVSTGEESDTNDGESAPDNHLDFTGTNADDLGNIDMPTDTPDLSFMEDKESNSGLFSTDADHGNTVAGRAIQSIPQVQAAQQVKKFAPLVAAGAAAMLVIIAGVQGTAINSVTAHNNAAVLQQENAVPEAFTTDAASYAPGSDFLTIGGEITPADLDQQSEQRAGFIFQNLLGHGLTPIQAAGVLGNIQVETGGTFSPQVDNPNDVGLESFGIVQWRAGRRSKVEEFIKTHVNVDVNAPGFKQELGSNGFLPLSDNNVKQSLAAQVAYIFVESATAEAAGWGYAMNQKTAADVAVAFDRRWERSSGEHSQQRADNAVVLLEKFKSLTPVDTAHRIYQKGMEGSLAATAPNVPSSDPYNGGNSTTPGNNATPGAVNDGMCEVSALTLNVVNAGVEKFLGMLGADTSGGSDVEVKRNPEFDPFKRGGWRGRSENWNGKPLTAKGALNILPGFKCSNSRGANGSVLPGTTVGSANITAQQYKTIVETALAQVGKEYVWGAEGPGTFDCSGLMMYSFNKVNVPLLRTAHQQLTNAPMVVVKGSLTANLDKLRPGDLLGWANGGHYYHIGMYIGNGEMVHASAPGIGVVRQKVYDDGETIAVRY